MQHSAPRLPLRVLVVDDSADAAESLRILVELWGHQARQANDAATALALAESFRPQVILMDIQMPRVHGGELARRVRALGMTPEPFVIATTATDKNDQRLAGFSQLFDEFMPKPYNLVRLEQMLAMQAARLH